MDEKKVREAIAKEKETIKTLEDVVVSGKTGSLRRWAKDTIENSTIIIEALEKQLPKKPKEEKDTYTHKIGEFRVGKCPNCLAEVSDRFGVCVDCGQNLDWSVENE